jgi:hypothetical protein
MFQERAHQAMDIYIDLTIFVSRSVKDISVYHSSE